MATAITIIRPSAYQIFQRDGDDQADIAINGTYTGADPAGIEARWSGGAWTNIGATIGGGAYAGTLAAQAAGQGTLEVRDAGNVGVTASKTYVGIGDVFVVAGQSNAAGRGDNYQSYSHATLRAGLFRQDDAWRQLADPTDTERNLGSCWPLLATHIMAATGLPVAFVTTAKGATGLVLEPENTWTKPGAEYNDCVQTVTLSGINGARAILWHQGEQDAGNNVQPVQYYDGLVAMLANLRADVPALAGVPLVQAQIGQHLVGGWPDGYIDNIRYAAMLCWDAAVSLPGPVLYDVDLSDAGGDGIHFVSDAELALLAARWWRMISHAFFGGADGRAPRLAASSLFAADTLDIVFDHDIAAATVTGWSLTDALGPVAPSSASVQGGDTLRIVCDRPLYGAVRATFASGNAGVSTVLLDTAAIPMPIEPIYDRLITTVNSAATGWWR
mgnify:CR=1 FL=1